MEAGLDGAVVLSKGWREGESKVEFWGARVRNSVEREAIMKSKFGMFPHIKATKWKWGGS